MAKTVSRLLGLEIDEVSLVDRPANQHGLVAITKRDEGPMAGTGLYDADGNEFDDSELEAGMTAYDANGDEHILLNQEQAAELEAEGYDLDNLEIPDDAREFEGDLVGVGKGVRESAAAVIGGARSKIQAGRNLATKELGNVRTSYLQGSRGADSTSDSRITNGARRIGRNRGKIAVGAIAGTEENVRGRFRKGMGAELLQELSKAYTDGDRDRVIAKAFSAVEDADSRAEQAYEIAKALQEQNEIGEYVELAKGYALPVDPYDLGPILHTIAKSGLSPEQLDLVDQVFSAAGEAIFVEKGFTGRGDSAVMEQIEGAAYEVVGKADISPEQATVALFEANPDAYLDYLSEQKG